MADWHREHEQQTTKGEKFGLAVNNGIGNMRFIVISTVLIIAWMTLNATAYVKHWDPYPFILLNLCFSAFAFYASPLILMAQNLQAKRDKVQAQHQYEHQEKELKMQTKILLQQNEVLDELRGIKKEGSK